MEEQEREYEAKVHRAIWAVYTRQSAALPAPALFALSPRSVCRLLMLELCLLLCVRERRAQRLRGEPETGSGLLPSLVLLGHPFLHSSDCIPHHCALSVS